MSTSRAMNGSVAGTALPTASPNVGVLGVVLMSLRAMGFGRVSCCYRIPAQGVNAACNKLKMLWPNAVAMAAPALLYVIPNQADWGFAHKEMMGAGIFAVPESSVAICVDSRHPDSAPIGSAGIDFGPEALFRSATQRRASALIPQVMHAAHCLGMRGCGATVYGARRPENILRRHLETTFPGVTVPDVSASRHPSILHPAAYG